MKIALIPILLATAGAQDKVLTIAAIIAAVVLLLNQFGLLPKGRTFERVQLERNELERELARTEQELIRQKEKPDLSDLSKLVIDHDQRMMGISVGISETLLAIGAAVIPPEHIRDD